VAVKLRHLTLLVYMLPYNSSRELNADVTEYVMIKRHYFVTPVPDSN
jgi:hypothetical protein